MKITTTLIASVALGLVGCAEQNTAPASAPEAKVLFNGKDLTGWAGLDYWSVRDGVITGQSTAERPLKSNTFLVWQGGDVADFELTFKYKVVDQHGKSAGFGNSGVQYRSWIAEPKHFVVGGYQADFECGTTWSGILYEEKGREILAKRGEKVVIEEGVDAKHPKITVVGQLGKSEDIQAVIKPADWNDYRIVAKGNHLQHFINGVQTVDVVDRTAFGAKKGVLALQLHGGDPMMVQFKDLVLKEIK
jgi:hypothetical protein